MGEHFKNFSNSLKFFPQPTIPLYCFFVKLKCLNAYVQWVGGHTFLHFGGSSKYGGQYVSPNTCGTMYGG